MLKLDKDMYITLKNMWESNQTDNKILFKGLVINNLDKEDLPTNYYKHLLVGVVGGKTLTKESYYQSKLLEYEFQLRLEGLEYCIIK